VSTHLPCSQACENNKEPILAVLRDALGASSAVLEIGSGTGQHAVHFAPALPHLEWHTSDLAVNHAGIRAWIAAHPAPNLHPPLVLDVRHRPWPDLDVDAVFSANTAHIMPWPAVEAMVAAAAARLPPAGMLLLYGPFRYRGEHTAPSNAAFDASLRRQDPAMGVRDVEALDAAAARDGLTLVADHSLPANNRLRIWRRV